MLRKVQEWSPNLKFRLKLKFFVDSFAHPLVFMHHNRVVKSAQSTLTDTNLAHMSLSKTRHIHIKSLDNNFCGHG